MGVKTPFKLKGGRPSARGSVAVKAVDDNRCSICQETIGDATPDGAVEGWSRLPCGHRFGSLCVKRWLGLSPQPSCPICRRDMAHLCGHPVVPEQVGPGHHHGLLLGLRKSALAAPCPFCKTARWRALPRAGHVLRFVSGAAHLVLPHRRSRPTRRWWEMFRESHRTEFGEWWAAQEPPTEPALTPPMVGWI